MAVFLRCLASFAIVVLTASCAVTSAGLTLARFTTAPIAVLCFLLIDVLDLRARRIPLAVLSYAAALVVLYGILEGQLSAFLPYLRFSIETSAGYSQAMSLIGSGAELIRYLVAAIFFGGLPAAGNSFFAWATLWRRASMRLMIWACSCTGGATISWPATLASMSLVSFSVYTSLYLAKSSFFEVEASIRVLASFSSSASIADVVISPSKLAGLVTWCS